MRKAFLRGMASAALMLLGTGLFAFSLPVAFGWDRGPFSIAGTVTAILGVSVIFGGYWLVRDFDGTLLASAYLHLVLGVGSTLFVVGLIALVIRSDPSIPTGYLLATGCLCLLGLFKFRAYRKHN